MARRREPQEEPVEAPKLSRAQIKQRQLRILLLSIVGVVAVVIAGVVLYQTYLAPFRKPVVTVDSSVIRMRYFLDRTRMAGNDPSATIQQLIDEQIVELAALKLGASVSNSEIDRALQDAASAAASNNSTQYDVSTRAGFESWFKDLRRSTGLSDAQYRDMIRVSIMAERITTALGSNMPTQGPQVHLHVIVLGNSADADKVKARLDKGEDFATVAKQVSLDAQTKELGGDAGWWPNGVLPYDDIIFQLEIGRASTPVAMDPSNPTSSQYLLFMVSEKDAERAIDANMKAQMEQTAFRYWLEQEKQNHKITYELTASDQAWVNWQLAKVRD